jgi:hypothetical protein
MQRPSHSVRTSLTPDKRALKLMLRVRIEVARAAEGVHAASLSHRRSSRNQADATGRLARSKRLGFSEAALTGKMPLGGNEWKRKLYPMPPWRCFAIA